MRVLVECRDCHRRFDASRMETGARFRCHCGQVLTVRPPEGHDASVVRCSSCGGLRQKGSKHCVYCNADFTIHERDLHTVCPSCLARVSDRAKFCAHCGARLTADVVAGDATDLSCPHCDEKVKLTNRSIPSSSVSFLECRMCAGLWMETGGFKRLRDQHRKSPESELPRGLQERFKRQVSGNPAKVRYRKCPVCSTMMNRHLYGTGSGVIIDTCRRHGIWFDHGELRQILEWIREGGRTDRPLRGLEAEKKRAASKTERSAVFMSRRSQPASFLDSLFSGLQYTVDEFFEF